MLGIKLNQAIKWGHWRVVSWTQLFYTAIFMVADDMGHTEIKHHLCWQRGWVDVRWGTIYNNDVIMSAMVSQMTNLTIVCSNVYSRRRSKNIKASRHWPFWGEFIGDRWILRTKGQWRGNFFHLMTSSWFRISFLNISLWCETNHGDCYFKVTMFFCRSKPSMSFSVLNLDQNLRMLQLVASYHWLCWITSSHDLMPNNQIFGSKLWYKCKQILTHLTIQGGVGVCFGEIIQCSRGK